jgi:anti-sigma-K factor RskA
MTSRDGHDELHDQLGLYVLGALTPTESASLEAHLAVCVECAAEVRSLQPAVEAVAWSVSPADPPRRVRQRVLSSLSAPRSAALVPWLAAAASIALALGLGVYSAQLRSRVRTLDVRLRAAILQVEAGQRQIADARRATADAQLQVAAVLGAPDVARIDLKGQSAAPQAAGRAFWSRSRGLVVAASNLPAPPPGRTYQLWILTARTPPISNRWLLSPNAEGRVSAVFNTAPDLPAPVAMAVTIEPDGGAAAPTGAKYLVGAPN